MSRPKDEIVRSLQIGSQVIFNRNAELCVQNAKISGDLTVTGDIIFEGTAPALDIPGVLSADKTYAGGVESVVDVAGAMPDLDPNKLVSLITTTQFPVTGNLPDGTIEGQMKYVRMIADGGDYRMSFSSNNASSTLVFTSITKEVFLIWASNAWHVINNNASWYP